MRWVQVSSRWRCSAVSMALSLVLAGSNVSPVLAQEAPLGEAASAEERLLDRRVVSAREAWRRGDRARLATERDELMNARHRLASWADYWLHLARIKELTPDEADAFLERWPGSYVEDRFRNDWLLELGKRRDWARFAEHYPRFRMNDDREVTCYALWSRTLAGEDVREAARGAWAAQRDGDDGCLQMARQQLSAGRWGTEEVWLKVRSAADAGRLKAARQAVALIDEGSARTVFPTLWEQPGSVLTQWADGGVAVEPNWVALGLIRWAVVDPAAAAYAMETRWQQTMPGPLRSSVWASIARQAAIRLMPEAHGWFRQAAAIPDARGGDWGDDTHAWRVRAALRQAPGGPAWKYVLEAVAAMSPAGQADPAWVYWKARALQATAVRGSGGDDQRSAARALLEGLSSQAHFYGKLAAEDLGRSQRLPAAPAALGDRERVLAAQNLGLNRSLALFGLGLRGEAVREWNYALRDLGDRELLAAAERACERQIWDRCINTSERTKQEVHMTQRFPTPFRDEVLGVAQEVGIDAAYVYGLIRQESRFVTDARSNVGASGLMQVMPATARWTARKLGLPYGPGQLTDRVANLRLGMGYLRLILDDFEGAQALAAAAYNAGPNRPRRWRQGPPLESAIWVENIPFAETRDYVKKVLSNASDYAAILGGQQVVQLKPRLGSQVVPKDMPASAAPDVSEVTEPTP